MLGWPKLYGWPRTRRKKMVKLLLLGASIHLCIATFRHDFAATLLDICLVLGCASLDLAKK